MQFQGGLPCFVEGLRKLLWLEGRAGPGHIIQQERGSNVWEWSSHVGLSRSVALTWRLEEFLSWAGWNKGRKGTGHFQASGEEEASGFQVSFGTELQIFLMRYMRK